MNDKVGIVLVNYNGEKFQNDCIRTIKEMTYKDIEIIVVDNGSKDNSINILKKEYKEDVIIIETGENCGVARGNNIGIKKALELNCEYILLLNNDTEVHKDMLSNMMKYVSDDIMVTPKMYYYDRKDVIWCSGGRINWDKATTTHYGENEKDIGQYDNSKYVEYTPTCCLLIHKSVFDKIGIMDEKYFMYYDDTDFVVRANRLGIKIWYCSEAKLWHKVSSSSGGMGSRTIEYYSNRNRLYFINKFYEKKVKVISYYYITRFIRCLIYLFKNINLSKAIIKAIYDYRKNNMYIEEVY